jgi:hypothetical protein
MLQFLKTLDRRWIFLLMMLSVVIPILTEARFPESPTAMAEAVFNEVEALQPGDRVLLAFDFDPASEGELGPMATTFVRHCCEKDLKLYFMALWPVGPQMIEDAINKVILHEFNRRPGIAGTDREYEYGVDYMNLGYKSGNEGVIKVVVNNIKELYTTDDKGTSIDKIDMMDDIQSIRDMDLQINVSAGYPGTKEWVQYAATPYPNDVKIVGGCTGVQAPLLYPYIPEQLPGLLGAIKGAAEYEELVNRTYETKYLAENGREGEPFRGRYTEAVRRMGPQLVAHLLIILLIVVANIIYFDEKRKGGAA